MRNPINKESSPLHAYTAMPIRGLRSWFPRDLHDKMEMGRYLGHTYNIPLYKIPQKGGVPHAHKGDPSYIGRHELYSLPAAPDAAPITDPKLDAHFAQRIVEHLKLIGAPAEQLTRLGLD